MLTNFIKATSAFLATNMDDLFLLVTFLMVVTTQADSQKRASLTKVFIGQITAFIVILLIADLGSLGIRLLPTKFIAGLGAVPLMMGLHIFWSEHETKREHQKQKIKSQNIISIGLVFTTILADGGDNLGVYIPYFSTLSNGELFVTNLYLLFLICVWCLVGLRLSHIPEFETFFHKYGENITGVILVGLGFMLIVDGLS
ncbi:cadmium resistance transporter [Lentilactobacillus kribbianus]|uniref:cadmium resistance transporter n=1 Tax=Lentilactobacillus kribbianus TaxID=2729622 RepID=UPI0015574493|nr:cadmium resistance transporter [Lentilactobacillus kribbianus]